MKEEITIWQENNLAEIKNLFAKDLNPIEFKTLIWIWKTTWLNPYLREIWAVKYWNNPANIFIWRDWYRKSAQANKEYDYHIVDAVYSNDTFNVKNGEVEHIYNMKDRWNLVWAYCVVKRKNSSKPSFTFVEFKEYNTNMSLWKSKPVTMIKKVAEAQWLRQSFQELFAWTYDEDEEVKENNELTEAEKKENFENFKEKIEKSESIEELQLVLLWLNKERQKNPNFIEKEDLEKIIALKDEVKAKLENNS